MDEAAHFASPLLTLLGVAVEDSPWNGLDAGQRQRLVISAVRHLLQRNSQRRPVCAIIEDLHWVDPASQAVLDAVVEGLATTALLLVVSYRPEYQHAWAGKSSYGQLRIAPLPTATAEALLHTLLGPAPGLVPLKTILIERTDGNPFFLEESVRNLVETGVLGGESEAHRLEREPTPPLAPDSVHAVIAARIDRLLPPDEIEYAFRHALVLEVAYSTLVRARRHALDARILDAIERRHPDRPAKQVDRLAHHATRGEIWDKALTYSRDAAAHAFARAAHRETVTYFDQALAALGHLPSCRATTELAIDLRLDLRYALSPLGEYRRILDCLTEAWRLAEGLDDERRLGMVSSFLCNYFTLRAEFDQAIEHGQRACAIATRLRDVALEAVASARKLGEPRRSQFR